jgi:diguanylate cyclase (GGDEF)-like protein
MDAVDLKKPELNVRVVRSLAQYFESRFGREALDEIMANTGLELSYLEDETNWVSMAYRDRLIHAMTDYSKDRRFAYKAGCYTVSQQSIGFGYAFMASLSRPRILYKKLLEVTSHFNRVGTFRILELTDTSLTCVYQPIDDKYMDDELGADFRLGQLVPWPRLCGLPDAKYEQKLIEFDGRQAYHYVFRWQDVPRSTDPLYGALIGLLIGWADYRYNFLPASYLKGVLAWFVAGLLIGWLRMTYRRISRLTRSVAQQQEEMSQADTVLLTRYNDLYQAYNQIQALNQELEARNEKLHAASLEIQALNADLEQKVKDLVAANREKESAYKVIQGFNERLTEEVRLKTLELQEKNVELNEKNSELKEKNLRADAAYQKLQALDRVKTQFFARINHELRTPLTLILPPIDSILGDTEHELPPAHRQLLEAMRRNALRLLKLINSLLDLARIAEGEMRLRYEQVDLVQLLNGLYEGVKPSTSRHQLELRRSFQEGLEPVMVDADKIEAAVLNLLSNAVKFTPAGGTIELSAEQTDTQVLIRVRDNGRGIAASRLSTIFDQFNDGGTEAVRGYGGTGIGLSLVKEFIQLHNGTVEVESEQGVGTTFTIRLPRGEGTIRREVWDRRRSAAPVPLARRRDESMQQAMSDFVTNVQEVNMSDFLWSEPELAPEAPAPVEGRPTILVIDDEADMLHVLTALLRNEYNLITARDAFEGEAAARTHLPDLILSDVMMAEKDGYSLCRDLRADPATSQIPIILMSANADADHRIKGLETGAYDFVGKPFNSRELKARININIRLHDVLMDLQAAYREMKRMSITDALTGVYNRRYLESESDKAFREARNAGSMLACMMIDIDHFKRFNSLYGHAGGDVVLKEVAQAIQQWFGGFGTVARYGGEEFAVLLPNIDSAGAAARATLFVKEIERSRFGPTKSWTVTISMGVAAYPDCDVEQPDELLRVADAALYQAKQTRNCCRVAPKGSSARTTAEPTDPRGDASGAGSVP